jgi:hypothetical protein
LWDAQPGRVGGREVDDQFELGPLLDRDIAGLGAAQKPRGKPNEKLRPIEQIIVRRSADFAAADYLAFWYG